MKFLVIGGTGLIGSRIVPRLEAKGHQVVIGSPSRGVNAVTGEGLEKAMSGVDVVVDVSNSPSFETTAAHEFFEKSGKNLAQEEKKANVKHHVALSVVGTDKHPLTDMGYFRAKVAQEKLISEAGIPYTIVRATQFYEFVESIAAGDVAKVSTANIQPISADDVAELVSEVALGQPQNKVVEIAGPEKLSMKDLVSKFLKDTNDKRTVEGDANTGYFGIVLQENSLCPQNPDPKIGKTGYSSWFASSKFAKK